MKNNFLYSASSNQLRRIRHVLAAALLVFAASQTLAQQHFHSADDLNTCVICAHGDHTPVAQSSALKAPTTEYQHAWRIGLKASAATSAQWPVFQSRAPPSP